MTVGVHYLKADCVGGDQRIERTDGAAARFELVAYLPIAKGCGFIERRDVELEEEAQQLLPFRLRHGAL